MPRELIRSNSSAKQDGSPHVTEKEPEAQRGQWPRTHGWNDEAGTGPQCCVTPDPGGAGMGGVLWTLEPACCVELETGFGFLEEEAVSPRAAPRPQP